MHVIIERHARPIVKSTTDVLVLGHLDPLAYRKVRGRKIESITLLGVSLQELYVNNPTLVDVLVLICGPLVKELSESHALVDDYNKGAA